MTANKMTGCPGHTACWMAIRSPVFEKSCPRQDRQAEFPKGENDRGDAIPATLALPGRARATAKAENCDSVSVEFRMRN